MRRAQAFAAAVAVLVVTASPARCADEATTSLALTLAEARERALEASNRLGQLRALERAAEESLNVAVSTRLPQLDLAAAYTRQSDVPELTLALPGGPPRTIFPNIPDNYRARLSAALPLYAGGRIRALILGARAEQQAAEGDVAAARALVELETMVAYWSLVTARENARVLETSLSAYAAHLGDARNRERLGLAARNEVLAVEVERDRAELAALRAGHRSTVAEARLVRLLGLDPHTRVLPTEALEAHHTGSEDLEALVAEALRARPERRALASRLAGAEARIAGERAGGRPQISVAAGYDYANPNRRILPPEAEWKGSWDVSVNVALRLFDGGQARAAVRRAQASAEALRAQLLDLDSVIRLEVTQYFTERATAHAAVAVADRSLASANENRRVASDRYREGLIPSSDLLDAEAALLHAGLGLTEALAQVRIAGSQLEAALGR